MRKLCLLVVAALAIGCFPVEKGKWGLYGGVVKGPVTGAIVTFFVLNKDGSLGDKLGSTSTESHGYYNLTVDEVGLASILAESSGGTYTDEATGSSVQLTSAEKLTAVFPAGAANMTMFVNITPLTHLAAVRARALAQQGARLVTAVDSSNKGVAAQFATSDIVGVLPYAADNAATIGACDRNERNYSLVLAGISQLANQLGVRTIDLVYALAEDIKDGSFDGKNSGAEISVPKIAGGTITLPLAAGTTDLQTAINAFIASSRNASNITEVKLPLTPLEIGINTTFNGWLYSTTTVMPARLSGQDYAYTLSAEGGKKPYSCYLKEGSSLPPGFSLAPSPDSCKIIGEAVIVTETNISPPFTITLADSSSPSNTVDLGPLHITTLRLGPVITPIAVSCIENEACDVQAATATGGSTPYWFIAQSMYPPPLGLMVYKDGTLKGTPKTSGKSTFGICVVDMGGLEDCTKTNIQIAKKSSGTTSGCQSYTKDDCCPVMSGISVLSCAIDKTFFNDCLKGVCPAGTTLSTSATSTSVATCDCP